MVIISRNGYFMDGWKNGILWALLFSVGLCIAITSWAGERCSGDFSISRTNGLYSIDACEIQLSEILDRINEIEDGRLRFFNPPDRMINCRYQGMELNRLLERLRVNFALVYDKQQPDGSFPLKSGSLLGIGHATFRPPPLSLEERKKALRLIKDLRDDNIPNNGISASRQLCMMGCKVTGLLEECLYSDDYQTRHVAAGILRNCCPDYEPSDRLLTLTLDLLSYDNYDPECLRDMVWHNEVYNYLRNASNTYPQFRSRLIQNLNSSDPNEQLDSALLLAEYGEQSLTPTLVPLLIPHLANNKIRNDACMAAYALYQLGEPIRPYIARITNSFDAQEADFASLIMYQLDYPETTNQTLQLFFTNTGNRNPVVYRPRVGDYFYSTLNRDDREWWIQGRLTPTRYER